MENSLRKLLQKFERDPTVGSNIMDLLSRYLGRVGGIARPEVVVVELRFHATTWRRAFENYLENLSAIQRWI